MPRVVFDIETIGVDFDELSQDAQDYVLKDTEDEKKAKDKKAKLGLWPLTGEVAAICLINPDTGKGRTYFQAPASPNRGEPGQKVEPFVEDDIQYEALTEKEILERFWQEIKGYEQFITFNGRRFDCPYIMLRSAALKIRPTRNLMPYRYSNEEHIDLMDQLTFYGSFRTFPLDFYCKSLGLESTKMEGMSGEKVQEYFKKGKYKEIARYCSADVRATAELFDCWEKYIRF